MAFPLRLARLFVILPILSCFGLLAQEPAAKKPSETTAPEQKPCEATAKASRTHCELSDCVQKVLYFSNLSQPTDLQDAVNAMRTIAEIGRVQQIPSERIVIIEGTAEQVALAERLAAEIDKDKRRFGGLGYRIELKVQESEGDKKLRTRQYSLVTDAHDTIRVSGGRQAPAHVQSESSSEPKPSSDSGPTRSIELRMLNENEHALALKVEMALASDTAREPDGAASPLLRVEQVVTVELDKPTIIARVDDPYGNSSFTIELAVTRIKDRP